MTSWRPNIQYGPGQSFGGRKGGDLPKVFHIRVLPAAILLAGEQFVVFQRGLPQERRQPQDSSLCRRLYDRDSDMDCWADSLDGCVSDAEGKVVTLC